MARKKPVTRTVVERLASNEMALDLIREDVASLEEHVKELSDKLSQVDSSKQLELVELRELLTSLKRVQEEATTASPTR